MLLRTGQEKVVHTTSSSRQGLNQQLPVLGDCGLQLGEGLNLLTPGKEGCRLDLGRGVPNNCGILD